MSISLEFKENIFSLNRLKLPSKHFHFKDEENYIKLVTLGEGIFPKDKINTKIKLEDSSCIFTTESATKIYPSTHDYSINNINIKLKNSNCEFINDELILYKNAKLLQFLNIKLDKKSTLFYVDILSSGRSYENFDFTSMNIRNKFYVNDILEYYENYNISGCEFKDYIKRHRSINNIYTKIYIKLDDNEHFLDILKQNNFTSFSYTKSKEMIVGVLSHDNMYKLKELVFKVWKIYRQLLNKNEFNLSKQ